MSPLERLNLGVAYEQSGKAELAMREYRRAERGGVKGTALAYQGNLHFTRGDTRQAERAYRAALRADPDELTALNNLAWILAEQGRKLAEAEALIRHALSLNPEPPDPYENTLQTILSQSANKQGQN